MTEQLEIVAGSRARFTASFKLHGQPWDPRGVKCTVTTPGGTKTFTAFDGGTLEHVAFGSFAVELVMADPGEVRVRFEADTGEFSETEYSVVPARAQLVVSPPRVGIDAPPAVEYSALDRADPKPDPAPAPPPKLEKPPGPRPPAPAPKAAPARPKPPEPRKDVTDYVSARLSGRRARPPWERG